MITRRRRRRDHPRPPGHGHALPPDTSTIPHTLGPEVEQCGGGGGGGSSSTGARTAVIHFFTPSILQPPSAVRTAVVRMRATSLPAEGSEMASLHTCTHARTHARTHAHSPRPHHPSTCAHCSSS
jgi:hypothetical protein